MKFIFLVMSLISAAALADGWEAHEASIKSSVGKIREKEKKIHELLDKKNHSHSKVEIDGFLEEIKKEHKELGGLFKDFEKERTHVRFEHPDQGDKSERKYVRMQMRSIEQLESEGGLDGKLGQVKKTMNQRYGIKEAEPKKKEGDCNCDLEKATPSPTPTPEPLVTPIKLDK